MLLQLLDSYNRLDTPVHRLPAPLKLAVAMAGVLTVVLAPPDRLEVFAAWLGVLVLAAVLAKIPFRFLLKRMLVLEPLVLGVAVLALFQPQGGARFAAIVVRSSLCLMTMLLFANCTPFPDMVRTLRALRAPGLLVSTLELMHRYLFVLLDESERMKRARASRTFHRRRWQWWQSLATIIALLFVRSVERAERIHSAMLARGWK